MSDYSMFTSGLKSDVGGVCMQAVVVGYTLHRANGEDSPDM